MVYFLTNLNVCFPSVRSECFGTVRTLGIDNFEIDLKFLLKEDTLNCFSLNFNDELNSLRMMFSPFELRINQSYIWKTFDLLQTDLH